MLLLCQMIVLATSIGCTLAINDNETELIRVTRAKATEISKNVTSIPSIPISTISKTPSPLSTRKLSSIKAASRPIPHFPAGSMCTSPELPQEKRYECEATKRSPTYFSITGQAMAQAEAFRLHFINYNYFAFAKLQFNLKKGFVAYIDPTENIEYRKNFTLSSNRSVTILINDSVIYVDNKDTFKSNIPYINIYDAIFGGDWVITEAYSILRSSASLYASSYRQELTLGFRSYSMPSSILSCNISHENYHYFVKPMENKNEILLDVNQKPYGFYDIAFHENPCDPYNIEYFSRISWASSSVSNSTLSRLLPYMGNTALDSPILPGYIQIATTQKLYGVWKPGVITKIPIANAQLSPQYTYVTYYDEGVLTDDISRIMLGRKQLKYLYINDPLKVVDDVIMTYIH